MKIKWVFAVLGVTILPLILLAAYLLYQGHRLPDHDPSWCLRHREECKNRKRVVCIGDSITHGRVSCDYTAMLARTIEPRGFVVINGGRNSELSYNVLRRLPEIVACDPAYVTILIGTNDSNGSIDEASRMQKMRKMELPQRPDPEWFRANLREIVRQLKGRTRARIALLTLPPVSEDPHHPNFIHSTIFNTIIRETAREEGIACLPLHETMTAALRGRESRPAFLFRDREFRTYWAFLKHRLFGESWDEISRENGFLLLTDYVHLNCDGAAVASGLIGEFILREDRCENGSIR
ncbi:MAG: hypothetical protein JXA20_05045 [Spirochaetes bacterium]|nr:hypothetical protein [Spirochaetota bacterium]